MSRVAAPARRGAPSVSETVRRWAERAPDRVCLTFHAGAAEEPITYAALARRASAHARLYRERGLRPGDAVVLFAHSTPGFVAALLGAQEAGLLAVPCPPPEPLESGRRVGARVREIFSRASARALLDPAGAALPPEAEAALGSAGVLALSPPGPGDGADPGRVDAGGFPMAYCQFTSGSGGRAKGVLLTHDNVAANVRAIGDVFAFTRDDVTVTWLPLYHDMGLVGYVLSPLVHGHAAHVATPVSFIARPASWLALMTRARGTVSCAPNFAYALCARKVTDAEMAELDLSSWRVASSGSEPVTRAAVEGFARRFAPCGFRASALLPCYGLAEDTLCATTRRPGEGARFEEIAREDLERDGRARPERGGVSVASVGRAMPGHQIEVAGADGARLGDRRVGEVIIRGESVMHGYLPGTGGEPALDGEWLRTGDLGYLVDGEIFLVGRKKDLIIRAGRNYYPQDLEEALGSVSGLRPGRIVAFAAPGEGSEQVVVAAELSEAEAADRAAIRGAIRDASFRATGLVPDDVWLVPRNALPLTSSGKVMRPEARRLYLERPDAG